MLAAPICCRLTFGADLSPGSWPDGERVALEESELDAYAGPKATRVVDGSEGLVAGTMSPIAVRVGLDVLRQGGTAADAAAAMALTQATTSLGSFVSHAGILQLVYFDATSGRVHSLDAGWASYLGENEPKTIPSPASPDGDQGRKTLVPGFMAGIGALHERFGALPFKELFAPAIWYAENGVTISRGLAEAFRQRQKELSRTEGGRQFLRQAGNRLPVAGGRFVQRELAQTLRAVAHDGARHMYSGPWGRHYVEAVRREGGKATIEDMERYEPLWEEPLGTTFAGHVVFGPGRSSEGGYQALEALNLIEALQIDRLPPYWQDAASFQRLARVLNVTDLPPNWMMDRARTKGVTLVLADRASKEFAAALAPIVGDFFVPPKKSGRTAPKSDHTAGVVVIDRHGNAAAMVHSINTVNWGSTGIVVDGIPVADAAAINRDALAARPPGGRMPDLMVPMIVTRDDRPVLAVAITGGVQRETVRIILGLIANKVDAPTLMMAPPLVTVNGARKSELVLPVGAGAHEAGFLTRLQALGSTVQVVTPEEARHLRGVGVIGRIDAATGQRSSVEVPGLFAFAAGY